MTLIAHFLTAVRLVSEGELAQFFSWQRNTGWKGLVLLSPLHLSLISHCYGTAFHVAERLDY